MKIFDMNEHLSVEIMDEFHDFMDNMVWFNGIPGGFVTNTPQRHVNAFGNGPIEQEIADLLEWLSIFDSNSIVECDYGGLAIYLEKSLIENGQPGLNADTSIEDVARSLAGLAAGDGALAGQGYERLVTRWRRVAAFEQAM